MVDVDKQIAYWRDGAEEDWAVAQELLSHERIRHSRRGNAVVDQSVIDSVQNYLRHLTDQGLAVSFAVVFGSQATGTSHEWSDIDLLVVSPRFDEAPKREDINRLWRVAARTDSRIEPIPCGARQWTDDTSKAILEIARREGTRVLPAA